MAVDSHGPLLNPNPSPRSSRRRRNRGRSQSFAAISIASASSSPVKAHKDRDRKIQPVKPCVEDSRLIASICKNLEAPGQVDVGATARALGYTNAGSVADRIGRLKRETGVKFTCVGGRKVPVLAPKITTTASTTSQRLRRSPRKKPKKLKEKFFYEIVDDSDDEDYRDSGGDENGGDEGEEEQGEADRLKRRLRQESSMKNFKKEMTPVVPVVPARPATPAADDNDKDNDDADDDESGWWSSDSLKELLEKARQRTARARQAMGIKTKKTTKMKPDEGK